MALGDKRRKKNTDDLPAEEKTAPEEKRPRRRRQKPPESVPEEKDVYENVVAEPKNRADQERYVTECCEAIREITKQVEDSRRAYQGVTDSLTDIQKIDRASETTHKAIKNAAINIVKLTNERNRYKDRNLTISDATMRRFAPFEDDLADEIKNMYAAQSYQEAIDGDIEKLRQEKEKLRREETEIVARQRSLKNLARVLTVLICTLFVLFVCLYFALGTDMTLPYLATLVLALVCVVILSVESYRNRRQIALVGRKKEKAIMLLNRVNLKSVNNRSLLEYNREKYGVKDAAEFESLWTEYMRAREYEKKFRQNTEQLNFYCDNLVSLLDDLSLVDSEIWLKQVIAITDDREMVEIRHRLNGQRQILRERIEKNEEVKNSYLKNIDALIKDNPDNKGNLLGIVEKFS